METKSTSSLIRLVLIGIVLVFTGVIIFTHHVTSNREKEASRPVPTKYSNYVYKVSLEYPVEWQPNTNYNYDRYDGTDGFFLLSAQNFTSTSIDTFANSEKVRYGAGATVTSLSIDGQDARLILSAAKADTSHDEGELIVRYPKPVVISGQSYKFLVLEADALHVRTIADSIKFIK